MYGRYYNGQEIMYAIEVAKYLDVSPNTLYGWRAERIGPLSHKLDDRVFYYTQDVHAFLAENYVLLHEGGIHRNIPLVKEKEAARILGQTIHVIQDWRKRGVGPSYFKLNTAIRYRQEDLEYYRTVIDAGNGPKVRKTSATQIDRLAVGSRELTPREEALYRHPVVGLHPKNDCDKICGSWLSRVLNFRIW